MSFTIDIQPHFDFKIIRIANNDTKVYIDIVTKGGLLNSWVQSKGSSQFDVIDGNDLSNDWVNFESNGFKSAKMNPFCCRMNEGSYLFETSNYKIEKFYLQKHAIHGLVYNEVFEVDKTEINDQSASAWLSFHYQKKDAGFPFDYQIKLKWTFWKDNKIVVETPIKKEVEQQLKIKDEQPKNKILTDEQQKIKHETKKEYLREYYKQHKEEINKINTENSKNKYYNRLVRELNNNVIKFEKMRAVTVEKWGIKYDIKNKKYYSTLSK
jgi:pantothenate kinase